MCQYPEQAQFSSWLVVMSYPAVLTQLKGHKNEWWETGYIVILTRSTSAAAWQSTELIKRLEIPITVWLIPFQWWMKSLIYLQQ